MTRDPLGPYFRQGGQANVDRAARELESAAAEANMEPLAFLRAITPIYQSDIAARTMDAGLRSARFDDLFELRNGSALSFDPGTGRLRFNPALEPRWAELEAELSAVTRAPSPGRPVADGPGRGGGAGGAGCRAPERAPLRRGGAAGGAHRPRAGPAQPDPAHRGQGVPGERRAPQ